jgi:hypothetical protein
MEYIMRHSYKVVNLRYIIRFAAEHVRNSGNHYCRRGRGGRYLEGHGKFFDYYKANLYSNNILSKFDIYKFAWFFSKIRVTVCACRGRVFYSRQIFILGIFCSAGSWVYDLILSSNQMKLSLVGMQLPENIYKENSTFQAKGLRSKRRSSPYISSGSCIPTNESLFMKNTKSIASQ